MDDFPEGDSSEESGGQVDVEERRPDLEEPGKYAVLLHNDDYTTMEFVVEVLARYFRKNHEEAMAVMLKVHHDGKGIAGIYGFEIAETKAAQVMEHAQSKGFPLKCTVEPVDSGSEGGEDES